MSITREMKEAQILVFPSKYFPCVTKSAEKRQCYIKGFAVSLNVVEVVVLMFIIYMHRQKVTYSIKKCSKIAFPRCTERARYPVGNSLPWARSINWTNRSKTFFPLVKGLSRHNSKAPFYEHL